MDHKIIDSFVAWIESQKQRWEAHDIRVSVAMKKRHEDLSFFTTAIAEFSTLDVFGNIVLYISGECEVHIFSNDDEKKGLLFELHEPKSEDQLFEILDSVFCKIANNAGF